MKIQILDVLYNEFNRLFIAGAKFSQNDPRISKLVPPLQQLGEKSPPLKKLAEYTENLTACKSDEAAQALLETGTLLYAILNTQVSAEPEPPAERAGRELPAEELPVTKNSYLNIKPIIDSLTRSGSGRRDVLIDAYEKGLTNDYRLYPLYSKALGDKYSDVVELVFGKIIPSIGKPMIPFLVEDFDLKGGNADSRRLLLLSRLQYEKVLELASQAIVESSTDIKVGAIDILKDDPANEELLLSLADKKKGYVPEAALVALAKTNSQKGKELILATLQSAQYKSAIDAARACKDKKFLREVFDYIQKTYESASKEGNETDEKKKASNIEKFADLMMIFRDTGEDYILDFCGKICADKKSNLTKTVIHNVAYLYFYAAAKVYSPEKHYDTFVGMYRDGTFDSGNISRVYFDPEEPVTIDKRWVKDFIQKEDVELLCPVMEDGDKEAVKCLVEHLEKGIKAKKLQGNSEMCAKRLIDIDYKGLDKILFSIFENCGRNWWEYGRICSLAAENAGKIFSKDYIKKFEALHEKTKNSGYDFTYISEKLKNHYGENKDGT